MKKGGDTKIMNLQTISDELNKKLSFPYISIKKEKLFTDHVYIVISLDKPETWANGYLENSRYIKAHIFCNNNQWETELSLYAFEIAVNATHVKILQKKNITGEQALAHVLKQLEKLK